jgi:hypothetical protein
LPELAHRALVSSPARLMTGLWLNFTCTSPAALLSSQLAAPAVAARLMVKYESQLLLAQVSVTLPVGLQRREQHGQHPSGCQHAVDV